MKTTNTPASITAAVLTALYGTAAYADDAGVQEAGLQEVLVTATRRAVSAQDLPISITAVTGASLEQAGIQETAASAWIALAENNSTQAISLMQNAADREDRTEKHIAMENRLSPMRELLGELLLAADKPAEALREFERSLKVVPNRFRSLAGAGQAAAQTGNRRLAQSYFNQLLSLAANADSERPALSAARTFLQK